MPLGEHLRTPACFGSHQRRRDVPRPHHHVMAERSHLRSQMDSVLGELEIRNCPTALVSDDHVLIAESLCDGKSFACMFAHGLEALLESGALKRLHLSQPLPSLDVRYVVRGPFQHDRTTHLLVDWLANPPKLNEIGGAPAA